MKRIFITLLIFIVPMILCSQDQKTSQTLHEDDRWGDINLDKIDHSESYKTED
ncbi:MAG: hypothetical protein ACXACR_14460 [Candidatus Hodarchaeales archaeon]